MALALDEPKDDDQTITEGKFTFCVEKNLMESIGGISIDISYMGFTIEPDIPLSSSDSSCSSCSSGSSCNI